MYEKKTDLLRIEIIFQVGKTTLYLTTPWLKISD